MSAYVSTLRFALCLLVAAQGVEAGELIEAPGWKLVHAHCSGCHDLTLVTSQRGDRRFWEASIRWMQRTQNLWQIDPQTEDILLTYLSEQYGAGVPQRRAPLAAHLLPAWAAHLLPSGQVMQGQGSGRLDPLHSK